MNINKIFYKILSSGYTTSLIITISLILYMITVQLEVFNFNSLETKYGISFKEIIPIFIIALLYFLHFLVILFEYLNNIIKTRNSHYTKVEYSWRTSVEGDFEARNIYSFKNGSKEEITALPMEGFIWFGNPNKEETTFRIIWKEGRKEYRFKKTLPRTNSFLNKFLLSNHKDIYSLDWLPRITPPLLPKEEITYQVEIFTPKTEYNAFTNEGTHMGFPVTVNTKIVSLYCSAPKGYKIELNNPPYSVVDMLGEINYPDIERNISSPILSEDECNIKWIINNPKLKKRYWINYKFSKIKISPTN